MRPRVAVRQILEVKQFAEAAGLGTADGDFRLLFVVHAELVAGFEPGNDFADVVDVDDVAAVGAPEEVGVEEFEELFEGAALGVAFDGGGDDADGAVFDGGEADLGLVDEEQAALHLDDELAGSGSAGSGLLAVKHLEQGVDAGGFGFRADAGFERGGGGFGTVVEHAGAGAFNGLEDAGAVERLEQVIDGVHVEGADRVLVVGGGEDDERQVIEAAMVDEVLEDGEAVEARHLDVEEDDVGLVLFDELDGFNAVGAFGEDFDVADGLEQVLQLFAGQLLIVDDESRHRCADRTLGRESWLQ